MKNATMLYRAPGPHEIHGGHFDTLVVDADEEGVVNAALADGWHPTTPDALKALQVDEEKDSKTRAKAEAKAAKDTADQAMADAKALEEAAAEALKNVGA
jgi:topoisomerase IA-like protein